MMFVVSAAEILLLQTCFVMYVKLAAGDGGCVIFLEAIMGEAKRRGSFEQRKVVAIKRNTEILEKQRLAQADKRQSMTPEERNARKRAGALLSTAYGMAMASGTLMPYKI